jgi:hypothetical protein
MADAPARKGRGPKAPSWEESLRGSDGPVKPRKTRETWRDLGQLSESGLNYSALADPHMRREFGGRERDRKRLVPFPLAYPFNRARWHAARAHSAARCA